MLVIHINNIAHFMLNTTTILFGLVKKISRWISCVYIEVWPSAVEHVATCKHKRRVAEQQIDRIFQLVCKLYWRTVQGTDNRTFRLNETTWEARRVYSQNFINTSCSPLALLTDNVHSSFVLFHNHHPFFLLCPVKVK